ncbi:MAG: ATPase [Chloroflexales bacterium]|nr:ATPase [Chloroflexales bacterium]
MQILIFSGYNQILQSSAAVATACHAARRGKRVLLASAGPAHLTGAMLGQSLSSRPLELEPNLAAMEVSPLEELGALWDVTRGNLRGAMTSRLREIGPEELPTFPGIDAIGAILVADKARRMNRFDLMVVDGPMPDSLTRALSLPDALRWLTRQIFGLDRGPGQSRSSQEAAIFPAALITSSAQAPLQDLRVYLEVQRSSINADTGTRVRLVVTPEELHMPAPRSTLTALGLYSMACDEIIVSGEPAEVDDAHRLEFSYQTSKARPGLRVSKLTQTPAIRDTWALRGASLYLDGEVFDAAKSARTSAHEREVKLYIPFLDPKELDIALANEEVLVRLGALRRHVLLPGITTGGRLRAKVDPDEVLRLWVE